MRWLEEQGEREQALRLGGALWWFWWVRGHAKEGRTFLERILASGEGLAAGVRAKALNAAGALASLQGQVVQAERLCLEGLALFRELGDAQGMVNSLLDSGLCDDGTRAVSPVARFCRGGCCSGAHGGVSLGPGLCPRNSG